MMIPSNAKVWAEREFGSAQLGNLLRTRRLVSMAATAVGSVAGTVTAAFQGDGAGREGAYRLLEHHGEQHDAVGKAAALACFKRAVGLPCVLVPIDGTSLTAVAGSEPGEFGPVGNSRTLSRGLNIMHAVCLTVAGTPLGVANQSYWTRSEVRRNKDRWARRKVPFEDKETLQWLHVMERVLEAKDEAGFRGNVWFQADRGADFAEFMAWASMTPCWVTVRAKADRTVVCSEAEKLWAAVSSVKACHRYSINVPRGENRRARKASLEIRFQEIVLALPRALGWSGVCVPLYGVLVRETSGPKGEEPIEWLLLTTKPVRTPRDAREVVKAYGLRWRIEECHKTWKSVQRVEGNQLKTAGALALWARILFSVSVRAERLKRLARESPDLPATTEFTEHELEIIRLRLKKTRLEMKNPTMVKVVEWVARLGGYTGKSSGGPPGSITIGRGLDFLEGAAWVLAATGAMQ